MSPSDLIFLPKGFKFSALTAGIKASRKPDLALISAEPASTAAAMLPKTLWLRLRYKLVVPRSLPAAVRCGLSS